MDSSRESLENYLSSMTQTGRVVTSTPENGSKPNEENPQECSEWTPVGNQRERSYYQHKRAKSQSPTWMVVTMVVVGAVSFSMGKMGEMIGKLLTEMGSEHIRILSNINNIKHSVRIKIRSDMLSKLENFEFGRFEIKLVKDNIVPARGIINVSHGKEINDQTENL